MLDCVTYVSGMGCYLCVGMFKGSVPVTLLAEFSLVARPSFGHNAGLACIAARRCGGPGGPLAMIGSEPRQARKGATVVTDSCAGVWLSGSPPIPN